MKITFRNDIRWLLLLPLVFNLILLTPLLSDGFPRGGDSIGHLMMAAKTKEILQHFFATGELRLWQDWYFMGYPLFYYYSPLPAVVVALLSMITGIDLLIVYKLMILLLYLAIPFAVYVSCLLLQLERKAAVIAALLSVLPVSVYGFGLEYRAFFDFGLFSQLFGMLLFMLGFAASYRFVFLEQDFHYRWFVVSCLIAGLAFLSHLLAGYFVSFFLGIFFVVHCFSRKTLALERAKRLLMLGVIVFVLSSFVLLPTLVDKEYFAGLPLDPPARQQGLGLTRVAGLLFTGALLDYKALPLLTTLLGLSVLGFFFLRKALHRKQEHVLHHLLAPGLVVSMVISFFLIAGKKTFSFFAFVPTLNDLQTFRFILPFHFFVLLFIGIVCSYYFQTLKQQKYVLYVSALLCFVAVILIAYGFTLVKTKPLTQPILSSEQDKGFYTFVDEFMQLPIQGRVSANISQLDSSYAPLQVLQWYARFPSYNFPGTGFHDTFSVFYTLFPLESYHDPYSLFNIQYFIGRDNAGLPTISAFPNKGYFSFGHASLLLHSSLTNARSVNLAWLFSPLPEQQQYVVINTGLVSEDLEKFPVVLELLNTSQNFVILFDENATGNEANVEIDFLSEQTPILKYYINNHDNKNTSPSGEMMASQFFQNVQLPPTESCGSVTNESSTLGAYQTTVITRDTCFLLLKVSYHPQWNVFIDGQPTKNSVVAPNLMGIFVPEGKHLVSYVYQESWWRKLSLIVSALLFVGLLAALFMKRNVENTATIKS